MTALISIASFLVVIAVLIIAHELGHFITARLTGVKVEEFGVGFPPRLLSIKRGETIYSLNAVPLGGFVKMAGEEDPGVPGSLASKGIATRLLVLSAGSLMNFLLPLLLFSIAFMVPHQVATEPVIVKEVAPNSPAARAGIESGDTLLSVNGKELDSISDLHRYIQLNLGNRIDVLVRHDDSTTETVQVVPRWKPPAEEGATGIELDLEASFSDRAIITESSPIWKAIPLGVTSCIETFVLFKNGIVSMIIGTVPVEIAGPVGIAQLTGEVVRSGISPLLEFAAFLSINLAIINIFPLPALDGGRIAFVLIEWLRRGKRISPKTERLVHLIGFSLLIAAMVAVTYQDIIRIISGEGFMP